MKIETIKKRLVKDRPMISVTLRMPEDILNDLKKIAPIKGFSGYQALIRSYVGVGIRDDLEKYENSAIAKLIDNLREQGVPEKILKKASTHIDTKI